MKTTALTAQTRGVALETLARLSRQLRDLSSMVQALRELQQGEGGDLPQYPPPVAPAQVIAYALQTLGPDNVARARLFCLQQQARYGAKNLRLQMAATAMATALAFDPMRDALGMSDRAQLRVEELRTLVFAGFQRAIEQRIATHECAVARRRAWLTRRMCRRMRFGSSRHGRRLFAAEGDYS